MTDHWRNEPLSKGEMYDALMAAAEQVEANTQSLMASFSKIPGLKKMVQPVTDLATSVVRGAAAAISKENLEWCPGWLGSAKNTSHEKCKMRLGVHYSHYIEE